METDHFIRKERQKEFQRLEDGQQQFWGEIEDYRKARFNDETTGLGGVKKIVPMQRESEIRFVRLMRDNYRNRYQNKRTTSRIWKHLLEFMIITEMEEQLEAHLKEKTKLF